MVERKLLILWTFVALNNCTPAPLSVFQRREPNNVQCFKNGDCLSDCCISSNGWIGICVGRPQVGQICGLFVSSSASNPNQNQWNWNLFNSFLGSSAATSNEQNGMLQSFPPSPTSKVAFNNVNSNYDLSQLANLDFSEALGYG